MSDGYLVVCATPIGNLGDVPVRLADTLASVDLIYAEDTRRTAKLLAHLGVKVPMRSLFAGNERQRTAELVERVRSGLRVALVSDAGTPVVSDPGSDAVAQVRSEGLEVRAVPGPSAVTLSLALSGWSGDRFAFEGFLPRRGGERSRRLEQIASEDRPVVLFVSPHRLADDLTDLRDALGPDRHVTVNRELTKMHEEVWLGTVGEAAAHWGEAPVKGEITLVVGPGEAPAATLDDAVTEARLLVASGETRSGAARAAAKATGLSRRQIYEELADDQERS